MLYMGNVTHETVYDSNITYAWLWINIATI